MNLRTLAIAALLFAAGSVPAAAQVLRYGGEAGGSHQYVREQHDRVLQTVNGRQAATEIESYWRLRATMASADPESLTIRVVHDSLTVTGTPNLGDLGVEALYGAPIDLVLNSRGAVRAIRLPADLPPATARLDLETTYRSFFPRLPEGEAAEGSTWSDTTRVDAVQNGLDLEVRRVNRYTSKGWATTGGRRVIRVDYESEIALEGTGEQQDAGIVLSGTGRGSGAYYFDPAAGAYVGGGELSEMRMVALVTAQLPDGSEQHLLIPIVQNRSQTITRVEPEAPGGE